MEIRVNEHNGQREMVIPGTIKSVGTEVRRTKPTDAHPEGAEYVWVETEITYPNGQKKVVDSSLWHKSLTKLPDAFAVGKEVAVVTPLEGPNAGYSKVELAGTRKVDISLFGDLSTVETAEEIEVEA